MRALLLGGQEFVGLAIAEILVEAGLAVDVLSRGSRTPLDSTRQIIADRLIKQSMIDAVSERYDVVVDTSGFFPEMIHNGAQVAAIREVPHYIFVSSASIYDRSVSQLPFRETATGGGDSIWGEYGIAKWACEIALRHTCEGALTVLRPPYVYGPRNPDLREQFVWARALQGLPVPIPGDGLRRIQFCYVYDLAQAVGTLAGSQPSQSNVYNIASGQAVTLRDWVKLASTAANLTATIKEIYHPNTKARDYFPFRDSDLYLDVSRILEAELFVPTDLSTGLAKTFDWFRNMRPNALEPVFSAVES